MKRKWRSLLSLGVVTVGVFMGNERAEAVPALEVEQEYEQPDGTKIKAKQHGDEYFNYVAGRDGSVYVKDQDDYWYYKTETSSTRNVQAKVGIDPKPNNVITESEILAQRANEQVSPSYEKKPISSRASLPKEREQNLLVVLVEFEDEKLKTNEVEWQKKIFGSDGKSVKNYFSEQTNGRVNIVPAKNTKAVNNGVLKLSLNENHPDDGNNIDSFALADILIQKMQDAIDYATYDTNKNNHIETDELHIMFILAGYEGSAGKHGKSVWGHKGYSSRLAVVNNLRFHDFTMFGERMKNDNQDVSSSIGVICHEFGHDIGLPDLYNTDVKKDDKGNTIRDGQGLGAVSLMSSGSWGSVRRGWDIEFWGSTPVGLDAYSKALLGFPVEEVALTNPREIDLNALTDKDPKIIKLQSQNLNEYFLLENRQIQGFDTGMTRYEDRISGGVAVYRINTDFNSNLGVNRQVSTLLEADEGILGYSKYDNNELFGTNPFFYVGKSLDGKNQPRFLTKATSPSTKLSNGQFLETMIEVLEEPKEHMKVKIGISVDSVALSDSRVVLEIGERKTLTAEVKPQNAVNKNISWKVLDPKIAEVDKEGIITGISNGRTEAIITTEDGEKTASCEIVVGDDFSNNLQAATPVELNKAYKGDINYKNDIDYIQIEKPVSGQSRTVMESNRKPYGVYFIDEATGKFVQKSSFTVQEANGKFYSSVPDSTSGNKVVFSFYGMDQVAYEFTIKREQTEAKAPTIKNSKALESESLQIGQTVKVEALANNSIYSEALQYSVSNKTIAEIDKAGVITGITPGKVTITVKDLVNGETATVSTSIGDDFSNNLQLPTLVELNKVYQGDINYKNDIDYIQIEKPVSDQSRTVMESNRKPYGVYFIDEATGKFVQKSSFTVQGANGKFYSSVPDSTSGNKVVFSFYGMDQVAYEFTIKREQTEAKAPTIKNSKALESESLQIGQTVKVEALANNSIYSEALQYSVSNKTIAEIDKAGVITGITPGKVTITVKDLVNGETATVSTSIGDDFSNNLQLPTLVELNKVYQGDINYKNDIDYIQIEKPVSDQSRTVMESNRKPYGVYFIDEATGKFVQKSSFTVQGANGKFYSSVPDSTSGNKVVFSFYGMDQVAYEFTIKREQTEAKAPTIKNSKALESESLQIGQTVKVEALANNSIYPKALQYSVSDKTIAKIDKVGVITGFRAGRVKVTVTDLANRKIATCLIKVIE